MKQLTIVLICVLAVGCSSQRPLRVTVLTYNIHHAQGMDKRLDVARIAEVIKRSKADLVALQEVDYKTKRSGEMDEPRRLAELTGMEGAFGPAMDLEGGKYGDAILSRFPIESHKTNTLGHRPGDKREPRCAVEARCTLPHDRGELVFISTHLDHTSVDSDRLAQATTIAGLFASDAETPMILAGDFNCEPGSEPIALLKKTWSEATAGNSEPTCPSVKPQTKIDLVFVKPELRWKVVSSEVVKEQVASDHRPVKVVLELLPAKAEP